MFGGINNQFLASVEQEKKMSNETKQRKAKLKWKTDSVVDSVILCLENNLTPVHSGDIIAT